MMVESLQKAKKGEPWFDDGNVVLATQDTPTIFRLHRGVLARHSDIFRDMFGIPQPPGDNIGTFEGCQVIYMYDLPMELSNLVKALYDGCDFKNRNIEDFFYLAGILRLSTKYFIGNLRTQAITHLTRTWSYTLEGHDQMVETALNTRDVGDKTYPYVHPLHVLNLAREVDVKIIVPSAFYFLSLYPLVDILHADHAKLTLEHPSKPSSILSPSDIQHYTVMFQHRLQLILDFVRQFCGERAVSPVCSSPVSCSRGFYRLSSQLSKSWVIRTGPLHYMMQAVHQVEYDSAVCDVCRISFQRDVIQLRSEIWDSLPSLVGLPAWGDLKVTDLSLS